MLNELDFKLLAQPLCSWYRKQARELPWRKDPSPYLVWISEIMLQQTRVEAVKPYFARFTKALPDVKALSECPEDALLKLWEGLGYYSRARNLKAAAGQIMNEHNGRIPEDFETLLTLKGIGHYTAGAISSIAYQRPAPAVDGNVLRVLTRVSADDTDIMKASFRTETEERIRSFLKEGTVSPREFNQALMELGAMVCVPNGAPKCEECPWNPFCRARKEHLTETLPVKKKAKARRVEDRTVFLIRDGKRIAIRKRPAKGLLAGLYEFPNHLGHFSETETLRFVREMGYAPLRIRRLADSVHIFSHVEWHMIAYDLLVEEEAFATKEQKEKAAKERLFFVDESEQKERYALPSAFAAYKF